MPNSTNTVRAYSFILLLFSIPGVAAASCGSAFCTVNTTWNTQGVATESGTGRMDLRYEFIRQDKLRSGNTRLSPSQDTSDTTELKTLNRNVVATMDYAFSPQWGISVALPAVSRSHSHIADPMGAAHIEAWSFYDLSDARVIGRYQFLPSEMLPSTSYGFQFGVKLPTGDYRVANADGVRAERALQPGTGSTDLIAGVYYASNPSHQQPGWFAQGLYQQAVAIKEGFRPGTQLSLTAGLTYPYTDSMGLLFQLNSLIKHKDSGINAEPDLSGGTYFFASPGISFAITQNTQVYGFIQVPIYQHVNGVQLTANWSAVVGVTAKF